MAAWTMSPRMAVLVLPLPPSFLSRDFNPPIPPSSRPVLPVREGSFLFQTTRNKEAGQSNEKRVT
jgi:hypothetical protein